VKCMPMYMFHIMVIVGCVFSRVVMGNATFSKLSHNSRVGAMRRRCYSVNALYTDWILDEPFWAKKRKNKIFLDLNCRFWLPFTLSRLHLTLTGHPPTRALLSFASACRQMWCKRLNGAFHLLPSTSPGLPHFASTLRYLLAQSLMSVETQTNEPLKLACWHSSFRMSFDASLAPLCLDCKWIVIVCWFEVRGWHHRNFLTHKIRNFRKPKYPLSAPRPIQDTTFAPLICNQTYSPSISVIFDFW